MDNYTRYLQLELNAFFSDVASILPSIRGICLHLMAVETDGHIVNRSRTLFVARFYSVHEMRTLCTEVRVGSPIAINGYPRREKVQIEKDFLSYGSMKLCKRIKKEVFSHALIVMCRQKHQTPADSGNNTS